MSPGNQVEVVIWADTSDWPIIFLLGVTFMPDGFAGVLVRPSDSDLDVFLFSSVVLWLAWRYRSDIRMYRATLLNQEDLSSRKDRFKKGSLIILIGIHRCDEVGQMGA